MSKRSRPLVKEINEACDNTPELLPELWALIYGMAAATPLMALRVAQIERRAWPLLAPTIYERLNDQALWFEWPRFVSVGHPRRDAAFRTLLGHYDGTVKDNETLYTMLRLIALCNQQARGGNRIDANTVWRMAHESIPSGTSLRRLPSDHGFSRLFYVAVEPDGKRRAHTLDEYAPLRIQCDAAHERSEAFQALVQEAQALIDAHPPAARAALQHQLDKGLKRGGGRKRFALLCDLLGSDRMPTRPVSEAPDYVATTMLIDGAHCLSQLHKPTLPFALHWYRPTLTREGALEATLLYDAFMERRSVIKHCSHQLKTLASVPKEAQNPVQTAARSRVELTIFIGT